MLLSGISLAAWSRITVAAADSVSSQLGSGPTAYPQAADGPEANLPFLFAVYIITWAAFFAYVFYISRRRREMQNEIEALKRAVEERDRQNNRQEN